MNPTGNMLERLKELKARPLAIDKYQLSEDSDSDEMTFSSNSSIILSKKKVKSPKILIPKLKRLNVSDLLPKRRSVYQRYVDELRKENPACSSTPVPNKTKIHTDVPEVSPIIQQKNGPVSDQNRFPTRRKSIRTPSKETTITNDNKIQGTIIKDITNLKDKDSCEENFEKGNKGNQGSLSHLRLNSIEVDLSRKAGKVTTLEEVRKSKAFLDQKESHIKENSAKCISTNTTPQLLQMHTPPKVTLEKRKTVATNTSAGLNFMPLINEPKTLDKSKAKTLALKTPITKDTGTSPKTKDVASSPEPVNITVSSSKEPETTHAVSPPEPLTTPDSLSKNKEILSKSTEAINTQGSLIKRENSLPKPESIRSSKTKSTACSPIEFQHEDVPQSDKERVLLPDVEIMTRSSKNRKSKPIEIRSSKIKTTASSPIDMKSKSKDSTLSNEYDVTEQDLGPNIKVVIPTTTKTKLPKTKNISLSKHPPEITPIKEISSALFKESSTMSVTKRKHSKKIEYPSRKSNEVNICEEASKINTNHVDVDPQNLSININGQGQIGLEKAVAITTATSSSENPRIENEIVALPVKKRGRPRKVKKDSEPQQMTEVSPVKTRRGNNRHNKNAEKSGETENVIIEIKEVENISVKTSSTKKPIKSKKDQVLSKEIHLAEALDSVEPVIKVGKIKKLPAKSKTKQAKSPKKKKTNGGLSKEEREILKYFTVATSESSNRSTKTGRLSRAFRQRQGNNETTNTSDPPKKSRRKKKSIEQASLNTKSENKALTVKAKTKINSEKSVDEVLTISEEQNDIPNDLPPQSKLTSMRENISTVELIRLPIEDLHVDVNENESVPRNTIKARGKGRKHENLKETPQIRNTRTMKKKQEGDDTSSRTHFESITPSLQFSEIDCNENEAISPPKANNDNDVFKKPFDVKRTESSQRNSIEASLKSSSLVDTQNHSVIKGKGSITKPRKSSSSNTTSHIRTLLKDQITFSKNICYSVNGVLDTFAWVSNFDAAMQRSGSSFSVCTNFETTAGLLGFMEIDEGATKDWAVSKKHELCFIVLIGQAEAQVHDRIYNIPTFGRFLVPKGAPYKIKNLSQTEKLKLEFTKYMCIRPQ